jgi:hypothetical protein
LIAVFCSQTAFAQEKPVPFFTDETVQPCALQISEVLAQNTDFEAKDLMLYSTKGSLARALPEATKYSNHKEALFALKFNTGSLLRLRAKLRPGFTQNLHELTSILVNVCTLAVFADLDPLDVLDMKF